MGPRPSFRGRGGGRGGRGSRGGSRGRGGRGGRGRGGIPWRSRFDNSRLAEKQEEADASADDASSVGEAVSASESESESEVESETERKKKAYSSLLKSMESRGSLEPAAKKRKLDSREEEEEEEDEEEEEEEDDDEEVDDDEGKDRPDVDHVSEAEDEDDDGDAEEMADDEDNDEDQQDTADPFETHFARPDEADVAQRIAAVERNEWTTSKVVSGDCRLVVSLPQSHKGEKSGRPASSVSLPPVDGPGDLQLKQKLVEGALRTGQSEFDAVEKKLAPFLFHYYDVLHCHRTPANSASLRHLAALHAVNHVFKTRDRVIKNSAKVAREEGGMDADTEYRDQGFTRPKVLILLPTRQSCARMVESICAVCQPDQQENRRRFDDSYVDTLAAVAAHQPADFRELFDGNDDDMFRLGLKFTRRSIKYFSQFYNADIILASPLGLRMAMGSDDLLATSSKKDRARSQTDFDFLSSIELVLVDQADALLMQNWEHVEHIFAHLNRQPRDAHGCDFSRVRNWYLDGHARHFRQTVMFSAFCTPALAELFRRHTANWAGKVRLQPAAYPGVIGRLGVHRVRQTFSRFDPASVEAEPDARFDYFVKAVMPVILGSNSSSSSSSSRSAANASKRAAGTLIFIPSYLDFVRVRNWFATSAATANVSYAQLSEYATVPEVSRAMSHFLSGRHSVLLYTERAHHFRRHLVNGVRRVVFYALPDNPVFYAEIAGGYLARSQRNQILEPGQGSVRAVFCPFDAFKLERIVGSQRFGQMVHEQSDTFVFEEER